MENMLVGVLWTLIKKYLSACYVHGTVIITEKQWSYCWMPTGICLKNLICKWLGDSFPNANTLILSHNNYTFKKKDKWLSDKYWEGDAIREILKTSLRDSTIPEFCLYHSFKLSWKNSLPRMTSACGTN